jgi:hypothetical protein
VNMINKSTAKYICNERYTLSSLYYAWLCATKS